MKPEIKHAAVASRVLVPLGLVLLTLVWAVCPAQAQTPTPTPLWVQTGTSGDIINTNAGNVGIGTPTPTSKLDVAGTAAVSGDLKAAGGRLKFSSSGPEGMIQGATERLSFWTTNGSGGQALRMRFGGNSATSTAEFLNVNSVLIGSGVRFALGTSAPEGMLDVRGGVAASGPGLPLILSAQQGSSSGGAGGNVIINSGSNGASSPNGSIIFGTGGSITAGVLTTGEKMRIDDVGRVGLGTTAPIQKLQLGTNTVAATTTPDAISLGATYSSAAGANPKLRLFDNNAGSVYGLGVSDSQFDFMVPTGTRYVWSVNGSEKMRLDGSGTFGIGTATPNSAYKLDVSGSINGSGLCIAGVCKTDWSQVGASQWATPGSLFGLGSSNLAPWAGHSSVLESANTSVFFGQVTDLHLISNAYNDSTGWKYKTANTAANYYLYQGAHHWRVAPAGAAGASVNWSEAMTIINSGNVGIGTANPVNKLDVAGSLHVAGVCSGSVPGTQGGYISWNQMTCGTGEMDFINHRGLGGGGFWFANTANGSTLSSLMLISGNGNVGIGTNTPTTKLDVAGNVNVTGNIVATGSVTASYQDVAEWVPATQEMPAGTVVSLSPDKSNQVRPSSQPYDTRVAGVISARPGLVLGEAGQDKVLVATTGRVKVKVDATRAPISIGDLIVTSDVEGLAMKSVPVDLGGTPIHRPGTIIGKALEPLASGKGEILVLLSLQ